MGYCVVVIQELTRAALPVANRAHSEVPSRVLSPSGNGLATACWRTSHNRPAGPMVSNRCRPVGHHLEVSSRLKGSVAMRVRTDLIRLTAAIPPSTEEPKSGRSEKRCAFCVKIRAATSASPTDCLADSGTDHASIAVDPLKQHLGAALHPHGIHREIAQGADAVCAPESRLFD